MKKLLQNSKKLFFLVSWVYISINAGAQQYKVDTLLYNGDINKYINIIILGDGYTSTELTKYNSDATNFMNNFLFAQSPYKQYKSYFNVFIIEVPSQQSGVKHPKTASDCTSLPASNPNNFYGTSFDIGGIHRLLSPNNTSAATTVLANNFPNYDQVYIVANSTEYGGAGGAFATFSTNASSGEIGLHEGGHSFGYLADEYWAGAQYAIEKPNMTKETSPTLIKWKNWLNVNGIGINSHTGDASWKKPRSGECKMEILGKPFCSVCSETIVEKIHSLVHPIYNHSPLTSSVSINNQMLTFSMFYMQPAPNTMNRRWILDGSLTVKNNVSVLTWTISGTQLGRDVDSISLDGNTLSLGTHTLKAYTLDSTLLTRSNTHPTNHLDSVVWNVNKTITGIEISQAGNRFIKLYPNPISNENLNITYNLEGESLVNITLLSMEGKTISTFQERSTKGEYTHSFETSNLASGTYLVRMQIEGFVITQRVVKK
jgi:hypothetical protein